METQTQLFTELSYTKIYKHI